MVNIKSIVSRIAIAILFLAVFSACTKDVKICTETFYDNPNSGAMLTAYSDEASLTKAERDKYPEVTRTTYKYIAGSCNVPNGRYMGTEIPSSSYWAKQTSGGGGCSGSYQSVTPEVQMDSYCAAAYAADCAGDTQAKARACKTWDTMLSIWTGSNPPKCPYCP